MKILIIIAGSLAFIIYFVFGIITVVMSYAVGYKSEFNSQYSKMLGIVNWFGIFGFGLLILAFVAFK